MSELIDKLVDVLRSIARFRWLALLMATLISLGGWAFVHQLPDQYVATARVFVDSNRVLGPLLKGLAVQADVEQRVSLMSRTLLNRPNLERLIRETDLDLEANSDLEREQLLNSVRDRVSLGGTRGNASLYNVSYRDSERVRARRVVQALLTIFIEDTIGDKRKDSETAQAFLDSQIAELEQRLSRSENRLSAFKRENSGLTPGEAGGYYNRLAQATSQAQAAQLELSEARNRLAVLSARAANEQPTLQGEQFRQLSPSEEKLRQQQAELNDLLVRFTERHPRVGQLRNSIEVLSAQAERDAAASASSGRRAAQVASPVYQEIRALESEAEARVAELEVRVREYERQREELAKTVESIPQIEARLTQLERDYEIVKEQYETLLQRRESARLSEDVEQNVDDIQFRVIDPPFVPARPSAPKKWLLSAGVLGAGLGAGGAIAFALSLLMPVYYSPKPIAAKHQRPIFGSVSLYRSPAGRTGRTLSWLVAIGWLGLLCSIGAIVVAVQLNLIGLNGMERLSGLPLSAWLEELRILSTRVVAEIMNLLGRPS